MRTFGQEQALVVWLWWNWDVCVYTHKFVNESLMQDTRHHWLNNWNEHCFNASFHFNNMAALTAKHFFKKVKRHIQWSSVYRIHSQTGVLVSHACSPYPCLPWHWVPVPCFSPDPHQQQWPADMLWHCAGPPGGSSLCICVQKSGTTNLAFF